MRLRRRFSTGVLVVAMLAIGAPLAVLHVTAAHAASGGPVILDGMDPGHHGSETGGTLNGPWIYIGKAYQNLMGASTHGTVGQIAVIGAADSTATVGDCGAGAHYAAAANGYNASYYATPSAIDTFFDQLTSGSVSPEPRLVHIVDTGCTNGLTAADQVELVSHASDIATFVSNGGALLADTENGEFYSSVDAGYDWLTSLLPGITISPDIGQTTPALTAAGIAAFPGLTNAQVQSPWHSGFGGAMSSLQVLATDAGANVIIGGTGVILTNDVNLSGTTIPAGEVGAPYTDTLAATGGTGPYTYAISSGTLPDGLTLDGATGIISGTPAADSAGTAVVNFLVTDSASATATQTLSMTVAPPPTLAVASPVDGEVGVAYTDTVAPTGGTGPFTWSLASGALPSGLTLNSATGVISGTPAPNAVGTANFTVQVTDAQSQSTSQALSIDVVAVPSLAIPPPSAGEVGAAYSDTLAATGPFTWSLTAGALPNGVTLSSSGEISGTPTSDESGTFNFTVHVVDSNGKTATQSLSLTIVPQPVVDVLPPLSGEVAAVYTSTLVSTFGTGPFTWSVTAGALPDGLTLNATTGVISGTPATDAVGAAQFTVHVVDSLSQTANQALILVIAAAPTLSVPPPPAGEVAVAYTNTFTLTGGTGPLTWSISAGALPAGLTLDPVTGIISGTLATDAAGTATFVVHVTDHFLETATQAMTLVIVPLPTIPTPVVRAAIPTLPYSASLTVANGTGPFIWTLASGNLPPGLALSSGPTSATSLIVGNVVAGSNGIFTFSVTVTDANGQAGTRTITITVLASQANSRLMATTPDGKGYWVADADGSVVAFGDAKTYGSQHDHDLNDPIVGMQSTATGLGYWLDASDGGVFAFGDAHFFGSMGGAHLKQAILGMAATPTGNGYWLVASDGGVFAFGDAHFFGSTGALALNRPIVGMAATPTGSGYWLVASDGGIFAFGDARFFGSAGAMRLNKNVVGIAATPDGQGYWMVASDGGIFAFGDAAYYGSFGGHPLNQPMSGISATPDGHGYWLVASDGGIFNFGDAGFKGSRA